MVVTHMCRHTVSALRVCAGLELSHNLQAKVTTEGWYLQAGTPGFVLNKAAVQLFNWKHHQLAGGAERRMETAANLVLPGNSEVQLFICLFLNT